MASQSAVGTYSNPLKKFKYALRLLPSFCIPCSKLTGIAGWSFSGNKAVWKLAVATDRPPPQYATSNDCVVSDI